MGSRSFGDLTLSRALAALRIELYRDLVQAEFLVMNAGIDPLKIQQYSVLLTTYINLMDEKMPEVAPPGKEKMIKKLKKKHGVDSDIPFKIAWSQHNKEKG